MINYNRCKNEENRTGENVFSRIGKLGAFEECVKELHRHLCVLNDFGKKIYFELKMK